MNEHRYTYVNGHRIAYLEAGSGPAILLVHGIPTSSLLWRNIIPELAEDHRVIAPDLLNYGLSDKPTDANVSIAAQSDMLIGLLDALGVARAQVFAHDIGGGVAQIMAVEHPERVARLALANAVCFDSWPIPEFVPMQDPEAEEAMSVEDLAAMMREFLPQGVHDRDRVDAEVYETMLAPWTSEAGKAAFFRNLRRLNPEYTQAIAGALPHLQCPTLVLWGNHDPFQKPAYAERLAHTIPGARLEWLEAAHWIMEEQPQAVARLLGDFAREG